MNFQLLLIRSVRLLWRRDRLLLLPFCVALAAHAGQPQPVSTTASNAAPAQAVVPLSVFVMPTTPQEGKDPFFPRSLHPYASVVPKTKSAAPYVPQVVDLRLGGISGTGDHRLAIINGQTLELGEEGEVRSGTGRVRIRVIDIKTDTVVVQVGAQQLVLRLRPGL